MLLVKIIAVALLALAVFAAIVGYCSDYNDFCKRRFGAGPCTLPAFYVRGSPCSPAAGRTLLPGRRGAS